jgi:hypothetical protein
MNDMVVLFALATQVAVDHLSNRCRSIYTTHYFSALFNSTCIPASAGSCPYLCTYQETAYAAP